MITKPLMMMNRSTAYDPDASDGEGGIHLGQTCKRVLPLARYPQDMVDQHPQREVGPQSFNRQQPRHCGGWSARGTAALVLHGPAWSPRQLKECPGLAAVALLRCCRSIEDLDAHARVRNFLVCPSESRPLDDGVPDLRRVNPARLPADNRPLQNDY